MAFARVVTFEGVGKDRIEEMRNEMDGDPPEGLPAKEIIVLHDPDAEKSVVIVFFDTEDDTLAPSASALARISSRRALKAVIASREMPLISNCPCRPVITVS